MGAILEVSAYCAASCFIPFHFSKCSETDQVKAYLQKVTIGEMYLVRLYLQSCWAPSCMVTGSWSGLRAMSEGVRCFSLPIFSENLFCLDIKCLGIYAIFSKKVEHGVRFCFGKHSWFNKWLQVLRFFSQFLLSHRL